MPNIQLTTRLNKKKYLSRSKHHQHSREKFSKWLSQPIEVETFDNAEYGTIVSGQNEEWICDNGHMWGFIKRSGSIIAVGTEKQQFGFFPKVQNPQSDDWHGYPVIPFKEKNKKYDISKSLLKFWVDNDVLNEDEVATIIKGRLL